MDAIVSTPRLLLRPLTVADAPDVFELNSNEEVMKYTGQPLMQSIDEAVNFLTYYSDYETYGYGRWACVLKDTGEFIGVFGLRYFDFANEVDIGGLFKPAFWNKGYAKEAAKGCINYGFEVLKLKVISGKCSAQNIASIKIMESLGMVCQKQYYSGDVKVLYYSITPA